MHITPSSASQSAADFAAVRDAREGLHPLSALTQSDAAPASGGDELEKAFQDFVGQTLFGSMLKSMRSTVGKPAYFHGGQTEEIFQQQLDATLTEELTESSAAKFADPMFELFQLQRGK